MASPVLRPDGNENHGGAFPCGIFSQWLSCTIEEQFRKDPDWERSGPIALGSWSRGELCPRSDLDLLFCGDSEAAAQVVGRAQERGVAIRHRTPLNLQDWTEGVEPFDVLSLFYGRPLSSRVVPRMSEQLRSIRMRWSQMGPDFLRTMSEERDRRNARYDSISQFLEPNIKYGPGGLRDLLQALMIHELFPSRFEPYGHARTVLQYYKGFWLTTRQKLHLLGLQDVLLKSEQIEIANWWGFENSMDFMKEIQKGVSRVSFYADWTFEQALSSSEKLTEIGDQTLHRWQDLFGAIQEDPSTLMQYRVRSRLTEVFSSSVKRVSIGRMLQRSLVIENSEAFFIALFRSRLVDQVLPELRKIVGLVQHDQYHRYSVDAHALQSLRVLRRAFQQPQSLGRLSKYVPELSSWDWKVLLWTGLYHDMAKGRGGDHAKKGAQLVKRDLSQMGINSKFVNEVSWMVEHHLLISKVAFQMNPQSSSTWEFLNQMNMTKARLRRLTIFTAVDIISTNIEAWTRWKERLLGDLVEIMESKGATSWLKFKALAKSQKIKLSEEFQTGLDLEVIKSIPHDILLKDYADLKTSRRDLPPLVFEEDENTRWIRFHVQRDRPGLFADFVSRIFSLGCLVRVACVQTYPRYGVYDWFQVRSSKSVERLRESLSRPLEKSLAFPDVRFHEISIVSRDENEASICFTGRDQRGLLVVAAQGLFSEGIEIRWARVHTWGRQVQDVFGVVLSGDIEEKILRLNEKFCEKN